MGRGRDSMRGFAVPLGARDVYLTPGADDADSIEAVAAQLSADGGGRIRLVAGTYSLDRMIDLPSNVELVGAGLDRTFLRFTQTGVGADTDTNACIRITGALNTSKLNTTLGALLAADRTSMTLTAGGTLAASDWVYLEGVNTSSNSALDSDGASVTLREMVQATAAYGGGTTVPLVVGARQYHAAAVTAKAVTPVANVSIRALSIETANDTIAVGILLRYARNVRVRNVGFKGLSRAGIDVGAGSRDLVLERLYGRGRLNSIVFMDSAIDVVIDGVDTAADGDRYHPNGVPRGLLSMRHRCTGIDIRRFRLRNACMGVQIWGGKSIRLVDGRIEDMLVEAAFTAGATAGENFGSTSPLVGAGICGGAGPLTHAEFAHDISITDVTIRNCGNSYPTLTQDDIPAFYWHDWPVSDVVNLRVRNDGQSPNTDLGGGNYRRKNGIRISDSGGTGTAIEVFGCNYAMNVENSFNTFTFKNMKLSGSMATGSVGNTGILLNGWTGAYPPTIFDTVEVDSFSTLVQFGGSFGGRGAAIFRNLLATYRYALAIPAYNTTGATVVAGDVVELLAASTSGRRDLGAPAAASTRCGAVVTGAANSAWCLFAPLPAGEATVIATTAVVAIGDMLVATTGRRAVVNNSPTSTRHVLGRAIEEKAAGSEGAVRLCA